MKTVYTGFLLVFLVSAALAQAPDNLQQCIANCPSTSQYSPVCGSDFVTYHNRGFLECQTFCGVDVQFRSSGPCRGTPPTTSTTLPPLTPEQCMAACPVTDDLNPVCGSDGITYPNQGSLDCQSFCVQPVQLASSGACPGSEVIPTPAETTTTMSPVAIERCVASCPRTNEYSPVCGSDSMTYHNRGLLDCRISCGHNIRLRKLGRC